MSEFLTRTTIVEPATVTPAELDARKVLESRRASELAQEGILLRLWRPPVAEGEWKNVGLWSAANESELHAALDSLPMRDWMTIDVTPLSPHPNDPALS